MRRVVLALASPALAVGALAAVPAPAPATVWLCRPGIRHDPCEPSLRTTRLSPAAQPLGVEHPVRARPRRFDCFYVYPTISYQPTPQATLRIDPEERSIALYQAARYSQYCRVFAPMYRQLTLLGLLQEKITDHIRATAYADVADAWHTYLRRYNHGRGVVLIGHSQGTFVLKALIAREIEKRASERRRLISAILLGGNVTVRTGRQTGGDLQRLRPCHSATQLGCVIAYSTFEGPVPANSRFGRTSQAGRSVLCTNPASLRGGSGDLDPISPTQPFAPGLASSFVAGTGVVFPGVSTPWVSIPNAYRARCSAAGGAHVLQLTPLRGAPVLHPQPDETWGLHLVDGNIALGNLVDTVRRQGARYLASRRG
jgi:pimeloyl-ACP methyl ester carboxylesterase